MTWARADLTRFGTVKSLRSSGSGGVAVVTEFPHGPEPYAAATSADGHAESSKPGCCQPARSTSDDFQAVWVTTSTGFDPDSSTWSLPTSPDGPGCALAAWIAMT